MENLVGYISVWIPSSVSAWFFEYFMFIFWSVIYATFIVVLVVGSAPYASGSGEKNNEKILFI